MLKRTECRVLVGVGARAQRDEAWAREQSKVIRPISGLRARALRHASVSTGSPGYYGFDEFGRDL